MLKVGIGYDIHRLDKSRKLFLGGLEIPYPKGLLGHSDGDALLHAVCDALLGALGRGDIGEHFPDSDPKYAGIASSELLRIVGGLLEGAGFDIGNIDTIIIAQEPRLSPFKKQMQRAIAKILKINTDCINIKAKTNEGLGEIGNREAIVCYAVATIISREAK